jgi:hypothetical protein
MNLAISRKAGLVTASNTGMGRDIAHAVAGRSERRPHNRSVELLEGVALAIQPIVH